MIFFGLNCTALRPEPTLVGRHVGTLCRCRRQGHACLPGLCLPLHPSRRAELFCSPLQLFAKHRGPSAWKISRLHALLLPAGLLPSLSIELLRGDCAHIRGEGAALGSIGISVLPCPSQVPNDLRVSSLEPCMDLGDIPPPPWETLVCDGPETLGLACVSQTFLPP